MDEDRLYTLLMKVLTFNLIESDVDELIALAEGDPKIRELVFWASDVELVREELWKMKSCDTDAAYMKWLLSQKGSPN